MLLHFGGLRCTCACSANQLSAPLFSPIKTEKTRMLKLSKTKDKKRAAPRKQAVLHTNMSATGHGESNYSGLVAGKWVACQQTFPNSLGLLITGNECRKAAAMPQRRAEMLAVSLPEHSSTRKR